MPQSLAQIYLHIVFSTKGRHPWLEDREKRLDLYKYLAGTCQNQECPSLTIGGVEDHVHILCRFGRTTSVADLLKELKRTSSIWVKENIVGCDQFHWQSGYGAFSISPSHILPLQHYIENQEEHHRRESYQDEFRRLLRKYEIEWDERYVWD
ncbi:MAG: transposase [Planctomycetales bacterium]